MEKKISERISDIWGVPKGVIMNIPVITIQGNREMRIEGYKNILKYTGTETAFLTGDFSVHIYGNDLSIGKMDGDCLYISGLFEKIEYRKIPN